jgi:arabinofuranosyltransferase
MAAYVIAIGGDFMHARMLLPATFSLLLPVMAMPVPKPRAGVARAAAGWLCVGAIGLWAVACGTSWRDRDVGGSSRWITDERAYWVAHTHQPNPDIAAEFVTAVMGSPASKGRYEWRVTRDARSGKAVLLYDDTGRFGFASVPLDRPGYSVADVVYILGSGGAGTPLDGLVVDLRGLSYALASHTVGNPDARPGHAIFISSAWIVAEYSDAATARGVPAGELAAARAALSCGRLAELNQATQAPLAFGRFLSNIVHSLTLTTFRFSPDPVVAEKELCG